MIYVPIIYQDRWILQKKTEKTITRALLMTRHGCLMIAIQAAKPDTVRVIRILTLSHVIPRSVIGSGSSSASSK